MIAFLSLLSRDPLAAVVTLLALVLALVVAITFHEFSHALTATALGDPTARRQGRLSLHPRAHLDPMGSVLILVAGFGWGRPVPVNPSHMWLGARTGMALTSLAGPLANVAVAFVLTRALSWVAPAAGAWGFYAYRSGTDDLAVYLLGAVVFWNLLLAAFNLLPIAPLDGFRVLLGILPRRWAAPVARLEPYGPMVLVFLIAVDLFVPQFSIIGSLVRPVLSWLGALVSGGQPL